MRALSSQPSSRMAAAGTHNSRNLDAALALIHHRVIKPEKFVGTAAVVVVKMGEADDVVIIASRVAKVLAQLIGKIDAPVPRIVRVPHIRVVDQKLLAVGEIDACAIGIAEGMEGEVLPSYG